MSQWMWTRGPRRPAQLLTTAAGLCSLIQHKGPRQGGTGPGRCPRLAHPAVLEVRQRQVLGQKRMTAESRGRGQARLRHSRRGEDRVMQGRTC